MTAFPVADRRTTARTLRELARPHRRLLVASTVVLLLATGASLATPLLLGGIVDVAAGERSRGDLDRIIALLVTATVLQGTFGGLGYWSVGRLGELLLAGLREDVMERSLSTTLDEVERHGTGDLVARVCGDVDAVGEAMRDAVPEIVASSFVVALTVVGLATLDWRLALAGLLAVPIQVGSTRWYLRRSAPIYTQERAAEGRRSHQAHRSFVGARTVRSLALEDAHLQQITETSSEATDLAVRTAGLRSRFFSGLSAAEVVGLGAVLLVSYPLVQADSLTVGGATAAALYFFRIFDPVGALLSQLDTAQAAGAALARLVGVTSLPAPTPPVRTDAAGSGAVRLQDVSFAYGATRPVLHELDLEVSAGERIALVGASGAGKSTIAKLILGIHVPNAGAVTIDGVDVTEIDRAHLAGLVTLVTQEVHVFAGPLSGDLRMARPGAEDAEVWAALRAVGAAPWVEDLPDGLETLVGTGGVPLGPTEAQQLALARLLLADPAVAVLDEATAEAGSAGARVLDAAANAATAGRTTIVIAHRLSQAAAADRIVVLDHGRIVEQGTHRSLLDRAGSAYGALWAASVGDLGSEENVLPVGT